MNEFIIKEKQPGFLPVNRSEMDSLGWQELDILLIQGDAYIDHPAQGPALLGRWLLAHGFKVGLISQPAWQNISDFTVMGRPRLFAALSAGSMDSMLAHYTAFRKKRSDDAMTPGGKAGARPNRATLVYTGLVRQAFPGLPVFIGGLEASLRRLSHYDFWQDKLRRSILLESKADLLIYGPGERPLLEAAHWLNENPGLIPHGIPGTALPVRADEELPAATLALPSHDNILKNPALLMEATLRTEELIHEGLRASFQASEGRGVLLFPSAVPLTTKEMDFLHGLPFSRRAHPLYKEKIPALQMLASSITTHRGCGGGCSFCSLALHQGRRISSRSKESIMAEAEKIAEKKPVALSDVGAPTANLWQAECISPKNCKRRSCLWPGICPNLKADQRAWVNMLKELASKDGLKQVRVASGVRYDLALEDPGSLEEFLRHFIGGQLKVAPEHLDPEILKLMRKPGPKVFERFLTFFQRNGLPDQYLIPYLISAFPGSDMAKMRGLAGWLKERNWRPRQVQAFIPTPGTVATAMYYAGIDEKGNKASVARSDRARLEQHAWLAPPKKATAEQQAGHSKNRRPARPPKGR